MDSPRRLPHCRRSPAKAPRTRYPCPRGRPRPPSQEPNTMRVLLLILGVCVGLSAQTPGTPVFTNAGPLDCGIRTINTSSVQTWCYLKVPAPAVVVCNTITNINVSATGNVRPFISCPYTDASGSVYMVLWFAQNAAIGSSVISYTIVANACTAVPGGPSNCPNIPIQTGTLQ